MQVAIVKKPLVDEFSSIQRVILDTYENGEFAHFKTMAELKACGDSLIRFLVNECSTAEDCNDHDTAIHRLNSVISQVKVIRNTLTVIQSGAYVP